MAHELTIRDDGRAEMAYVGKVPWHGLGNQLEAGAPIEEWQTAAGMDWRIRRATVHYGTEMTEEGEVIEMREMPRQHVLFRSDNLEPLSVVSPMFQIVQPAQVLEFFRDLVDGNGYTLETAGTLFGGRRMWALASVGEEAQVVGHDTLKPYLLLSTSCDGTIPTEVRETTTRVVCNNTLRVSLAGQPSLAMRVSHRTRFQPDEVHEQLGLAKGHFREFLAQTRALAKKRVHLVAAKEFIGELLTETKTVVPTEKRPVDESKPFAIIRDLFMGQGQGATLPGAEGTYWGLVNAVTEYVDHRAQARSTNNRLSNAWFGLGDDLKTSALNKALALV
jgi:phage/plasmid-like protein (TIGR03299 family)